MAEHGVESSGGSDAYPMNEDYKGMRVRWVGIDMANNGYIVSYTMKQDKPKGSMDHCDWGSEHKELFGESEEDKAWMYYKKYKMMEMHYDYKKKGNAM